GFPMLERLPNAEYQIQQLASGWNWYSTYIEQNDADGLSMLESGLGSHGELIMSRTGAMVENFEGSFWWGDLNAVTNEEMYEIKTNAQTNVVLTGGKAMPSSHPITVAPGWNWIGYVSNTSNSIDNALSSLTSNEDDIIQSRNAFSSYFPGYGWYGDLENMTPGQGYMYKSNGTVSQTLVYPTASRSNESEAVAYHNQADYNRYRNVMDVMAKVIINGKPTNSNRYELAAFIDGECRGRAKLQYVEPIETYMAFITINGNEGEEIDFRLYDEDSAETYEADDSNIVLFKPNEVIGKFRAPYIIRFSNAETEGTTLFTIYPNPVDKDAEFTIDIPTNEKIVEVIITNSVGSIIRDERALKGNVLKGLSQSGVYNIQIITEKGNNYRGRVIVK
ncbi:MAG: T9SS type A sorting domain-containing protein, partial [Bacteroidales bacterium]|nr:T9SS type A sorting domain-containing protein [Bacteroidales bacterium]